MVKSGPLNKNWEWQLFVSYFLTANFFITPSSVRQTLSSLFCIDMTLYRVQFLSYYESSLTSLILLHGHWLTLLVGHQERHSACDKVHSSSHNLGELWGASTNPREPERCPVKWLCVFLLHIRIRDSWCVLTAIMHVLSSAAVSLHCDTMSRSCRIKVKMLHLLTSSWGQLSWAHCTALFCISIRVVLLHFGI